MALFGPGVCLIPPDKESSIKAYVDGVIMSAVNGTVTGAVPNTVTNTEDGAVLSDGTMGVQQRQLSGTANNFFIYDTDFTQLATQNMWTGSNTLAAPPPVSDFDSIFYLAAPPGNPSVKAISKAGVIGATTGPLDVGLIAFAVSTDNATLYYFGNGSSGNIYTWDMMSNTAGPLLFDGSTLPTGIGTGRTMRYIPTLNTLVAIMNNITTGFLELWQFSTTTGDVLTKTVLAGLVGNTSATIQVDVGMPSQYFWTRSYPGANDREDGCIFQVVRLSDGAITTSFSQTIALVDSGVDGGILPATCPVYGWLGAAPPTTQTQVIRRQRRFLLPSSDDNTRMTIPILELLMRTGIGLTPAAWNTDANVPQGANPQVMMRISKDGGKTWGPERWRSAGQIGQYLIRVRWLQATGNYRNAVCEITVTDPNDWQFLSMEGEPIEGSS